MDGLWNGKVSNLQWAMGKLRGWQNRQRVPVCVVSTAALMQHAIDDRAASLATKPHKEEMLRMTGSMAVIRLVNGLVDVSAGRSAFRSVAVVAERLGIPRSAVDLRHESTHQVLPTLASIRIVRDELLIWLQHRYWHAQYDALNAEIERAHAAILNPLEAAAAEYASAAAADHEKLSEVESDHSGSTDTVAATSQAPSCVTFREPKRGDVLCGAIHAPATSSKKRRTRKHHDDPEGSPLPSPPASSNSPFLGAPSGEPVPPSLAVCSLRAPAVAVPKGHAALAAHMAVLSAIPGTPEHKSLFTAESTAGRARAIAGTGDLVGSFDAMGHYLGKGRGSRKRQRAIEAASMAKQPPGLHEPHALPLLLCPLTSSPSLILAAVLVPLLLDGRPCSPGDLGTPNTSPGPHIHDDELYTAAVLDLQGMGAPPPAEPELPQHPPPGAAPLLPVPHSPLAEDVYSAASVSTTESIFHATREAWTPFLFDLQSRLPNCVPTLVVFLVHRLLHEEAPGAPFPASARQHMQWLWLRFFLSRRWHSLFHHELALAPSRLPAAATHPLPSLRDVLLSGVDAVKFSGDSAGAAPWGVPISGSAGGGNNSWQQLLLCAEWSSEQQQWMDRPCPLNYCSGVPRVEDDVAMRIVHSSLVQAALEASRDEFEPPYTPLGGVLPLMSLTHLSAAGGRGAGAKPVLALLAALGVQPAKSILGGQHPWWDPPSHNPLADMVTQLGHKAAAGSAPPAPARQVAFAAEAHIAGSGSSPIAESPIQQHARAAQAAKQRSAAAPVTPVHNVGTSAGFDVSTAITPAFDETAVLSLDDIENMLGMSASAEHGDTSASAITSGHAAGAGHAARQKQEHGGRGTAPPKVRGKRNTGSIFGGAELNDTVSDASLQRREFRGAAATSQMLSFEDDSADRGDHVQSHPQWRTSDEHCVLPESFALGRVFQTGLR